MTDEQQRDGGGSTTMRREEGDQLHGLRGRVAADSVTLSRDRNNDGGGFWHWLFFFSLLRWFGLYLIFNSQMTKVVFGMPY